MKIKLLQASSGDSMWVSFLDSQGLPKNILIDGATSMTYSYKDQERRENKSW